MRTRSLTNSLFSTRFFFGVSIFALIFALCGIRQRILSDNLTLMGLKSPPLGKNRIRNSFLFRLKLGFHLFKDLKTLVFGPRPLPQMSPGSEIHLKFLQKGPNLLLAAHFHNWEAQASALTRLGVPLLGAARPLASGWADMLLRRLRARNRVPVVVREVPRAALRHLRSGGCFGFLWDQHAPDSPDSGTFFGHPVRLNPLPFSLLEALRKSGPCPVYFGAWLPGGELRLVPLLRGFDGDWRTRLARRYHRVLETLIRRHPTYAYGLLHARFKGLGVYREHRDSRGRSALT